MIKYFVIQIVNSTGASNGVWHKSEEGNMFICRVNQSGTGYVTENYIDEYCSNGLIEPQFAKVLATFEAEDSY